MYNEKFAAEVLSFIKHYGSAEKALAELNSEKPPHKFRRANKVLKKVLRRCIYFKNHPEELRRKAATL